MASEILPKEAADALRDLAAGKLLIGWPDGNKTAIYATENRDYRKRTGNRTPSIKKPVSLALIGRTLNYGREPGVTLEGHAYGPIPARPFMALATENLKKKMPRILKKWLPLLLSGRVTYAQFMAYMGQRGVDELKAAMREGQWAPLSARTLSNRRHGGDVPLIDTGKLINSISFEIKK